MLIIRKLVIYLIILVIRENVKKSCPDHTKNVGSCSYQNYNPAAISQEVDFVRKKLMTIRRASKTYDIPRITISNNLYAKQLIKKPGGQTVLNSEEGKLVTGLLKFSKYNVY